MSDFTRVPSGFRGATAPRRLPQRGSPPNSETHTSFPDRPQSSDTDSPVGLVVPIEEAAGRPFVVSLSGRQVDPMSSTWVLSKDITLAVGATVVRLAPALRDPYRRVMTFYAKNRAPSSCKNIETCLHHFLDETGHRTFSRTQLKNYRARLGRHTEWKLATLRGFLQRWHRQGYPGVSDAVVAYLALLRLKGNEKGTSVLSRDPRRGPFDDQELEAILAAAPQQFERGEIDLTTLFFVLLLAHTGHRPGQLSMLRTGDVQRSVTVDGRQIDVLRIPRAKQRASKPRSKFRNFWLPPDVRRLLEAQRSEVIAALTAQLGELPADVASDLPFFLSPVAARSLCSVGDLREALRSDLPHLSTAALRQRLAKISVVSVRTGGPLHLTPSRFRYTLGTRAAREGYGAFVIAELLDHSDTQQVEVYTRDHPNFRIKIDAAVGQHLVPLARLFSGTVVDTEARARNGADPAMRVGMREQKVGTCGTNGFCGAEVYACYTCMHFQPWRDAPHEKMLTWFLEERRRVLASGASERVVASTDQSILAVRAVMDACASRRAELEGEPRA